MRLFLQIALLLVLLTSAWFAVAAQPDDPENELLGIAAPAIGGGRGWLNIDGPLTLEALRGKVVLLDFWTYGCINCLHIIPDLKRLEARYPKNLVVIGVHSAKFENESETANIRNIIIRYGVEHPVVNDADFKIWNRYRVNAWPTRIIIDPAGKIIGRFSGEGDFEAIERMIAASIAAAKTRGKLDETPLALALERAKVGNLPLAFPGKILADEASNRLFIADSGHNRIVVTDLDGKLVETIGSGIPGAKDGGFADGEFSQPQGMALGGGYLYVADRENHRIRRVDLAARRVETIAGTGNIDDFDNNGGKGLATGLRSPWDLALSGRTLYIAMAGSHQIWRMDLGSGFIEPFAGNRWEARRDGPRLKASFAQPSGLSISGDSLYVADSESNIIRRIDLRRESVETLAGGDLFEFGDEDGEGDEVRLQHPLGVFAYDGRVLIADTYNHKIKSLDPARGAVRTLYGSGRPGQADGRAPTFYEPGGIGVAAGKLYVADTNNHAVRVIDLKTGSASTLRIVALTPPRIAELPTDPLSSEPITLAPTAFSASGTNEISIALGFPAGFHLNPNAPHRVETVAEGAGKTEKSSAKFSSLPVRMTVRIGPETTLLTVRATFTYCREDNTGVCRIKSVVWKIPVVRSEQKADSVFDLAATVR